MRLAYRGWGGKRSTSTTTVDAALVDTTLPVSDWAARTAKVEDRDRGAAEADARGRAREAGMVLLSGEARERAETNRVCVRGGGSGAET